MMEDKIKLEICCFDILGVHTAKTGGADYIELCSSLETGGLTPSSALIQEACKIFPGAVNVLIRPRSGDFLYNQTEIDLISADIRFAVSCGASGIVTGALLEDGSINIGAMLKFKEAAGRVPITFHRAFDVCSDPFEGLEQIIEIGCKGILTSGCAPSAIEGVETLRKLVEKAEGRIKIKAAAGITPDNVAFIIQKSGVRYVHASAKGIVRSRMLYRNAAVSMGSTPADEYTRPCTSLGTVHLLSSELHK